MPAGTAPCQQESPRTFTINLPEPTLMHPLLAQISHRPIPMSRKPWIMRQKWHDLLFAHWAVAPEQVQRVVPRELDLDLFDGQAYVGVVPFWMSGIRAHFAPPLPGLSTFPELNVRTYVRYENIPGVYFFSLDAASLPAVWGARAFYALPYFHAQMSVQSAGERFDYTSRRLSGPPAEFQGRYWPIAGSRARGPSPLEQFLTERYCLYTAHGGKVYRSYIHHTPWPLEGAEAEISVNTMASAAGIELPSTKPLLHFARNLEVLIWWPERA
jgi:uncharacterized protein YqjF (DUF2071 family)